MYAKYYENPTMLSKVSAKNVGDVFWDTLYMGRLATTCGPFTHVRTPVGWRVWSGLRRLWLSKKLQFFI